MPDDLYVHKSAVDALGPLLRVYEGCGRTYLGEVEGANLIKIHRRSGKISYLVYPEFESDPHPALLRCIRLSLRTRELHCYDYAGSDNPPILHRKETFLGPDHRLYAKFARLTRQEEQHGLYAETATIGTRAGWQGAVGGGGADAAGASGGALAMRLSAEPVPFFGRPCRSCRAPCGRTSGRFAELCEGLPADELLFRAGGERHRRGLSPAVWARKSSMRRRRDLISHGGRIQIE